MLQKRGASVDSQMRGSLLREYQPPEPLWQPPANRLHTPRHPGPPLAHIPPEVAQTHPREYNPLWAVSEGRLYMSIPLTERIAP